MMMKDNGAGHPPKVATLSGLNYSDGRLLTFHFTSNHVCLRLPSRIVRDKSGQCRCVSLLSRMQDHT
jgi:hypothetical protein